MSVFRNFVRRTHGSGSQRSRPVLVGLALLTVYAVWGSGYLVIAVGVKSLPPLYFCSLRCVLAAPLLLALAWLRGERFPADGRTWRLLALTALIMQVLASGLTAFALQWVASGEAALIMSSSALWIAWLGSIGAQAVLPGFRTWLCIGLGMLGLVALIAPRLQFAGAAWMAYAAILLAALCWSLGSILLRRYAQSAQMVGTAAIHVLIAGLVMGVASVVWEAPGAVVWNNSALMALLFAGLANSFLAYAAYYWLIHQVSPAVLGSFAYVTPAIAVVLGAVCLGESLSGVQGYGALMVLMALIGLLLSAGTGRHWQKSAATIEN